MNRSSGLRLIDFTSTSPQIQSLSIWAAKGHEFSAQCTDALHLTIRNIRSITHSLWKKHNSKWTPGGIFSTGFTHFGDSSPGKTDYSPEGNEARVLVATWLQPERWKWPRGASQVGGWVVASWWMTSVFETVRVFQTSTILASCSIHGKNFQCLNLYFILRKQMEPDRSPNWNPRDVPGIRKAWRKVLPWSQKGGSHQIGQKVKRDWWKSRRLVIMYISCFSVYYKYMMHIQFYRHILSNLTPGEGHVSCMYMQNLSALIKHMWGKNSLHCHPALRRHLQMALVDQQGHLGSTGSKSSYLNTQDPRWAHHIHIILSSSVWRRALKRLERLSKWSWVFLGDQQHAGNVAFN